jgi:hypothetical protein
MNRLLLTTALAAMLPVTAAIAGSGTTPISSTGHFTVLLGIGVEFGDSQPDVGITGKVLASPVSNFVAGGGATYFPGSNTFGLDLSAGVNFNGFAALGGYDFLTQKPQVSVGFAPVWTTLTCPPGYSLSGDVCLPNASDRRVKRDIVHIASLSDGMRLYSFRYLWSDTVYVGVMAQDLLEDSRWSHSVVTGADGFYLVDYDKLDLVMATLDDWNSFGLDAVVLGSRPAEFLATQAA